METRQITQVYMHTLILNPMTSKAEGQQLFAVSFEKQALIDFYHNERDPKGTWTDDESGVEDYTGTAKGYHKTFRKGSKLEWANPVDGDLSIPIEQSSFGHGLSGEWISEEFAQKIAIEGHVALELYNVPLIK
jgi:hypothetical protein